MSITDDSLHQVTRAAVAAGALFIDQQGRVLLVRPTYKPYWDIPGGYVESGESPYDGCRREVLEELGIEPPIGELIAVDWAPHPSDGDKLLFIFDGGHLPYAMTSAIKLQEQELSEYRFIAIEDLPQFTITRLADRLKQALVARANRHPTYLERGERRTA